MPDFNKDFYAILGVSRFSSIEEVKIVFRKLAKIHHPDKDPLNTGEEFTKILEAYEVLSDAESKKKYDLKLRAKESSSGRKSEGSAKTKNDRFSEAELKRRQYYQENYKARTESYKPNASKSKSSYNESKIILFAIPIAVALLFFIINIYGKDETIKDNSVTQITEIDSTLLNKLNQTAPTPSSRQPYETVNKAEPYVEWFGKNRFDSIPSENLIITNQLKTDLIFCLMNKKTSQIDCHFLLKSGSDVSLDRMLSGTYLLKGYTGKNFNPSKKIKDKNIFGGFEEQEVYFSLQNNLIPIQKNETKTLSIFLDEKTILSNKISANKFFEVRKN